MGKYYTISIDAKEFNKKLTEIERDEQYVLIEAIDALRTHYADSKIASTIDKCYKTFPDAEDAKASLIYTLEKELVRLLMAYNQISDDNKCNNLTQRLNNFLESADLSSDISFEKTLKDNQAVIPFNFANLANYILAFHETESSNKVKIEEARKRVKENLELQRKSTTNLDLERSYYIGNEKAKDLDNFKKNYYNDLSPKIFRHFLNFFNQNYIANVGHYCLRRFISNEIMLSKSNVHIIISPPTNPHEYTFAVYMTYHKYKISNGEDIFSHNIIASECSIISVIDSDPTESSDITTIDVKLVSCNFEVYDKELEKEIHKQRRREISEKAIQNVMLNDVEEVELKNSIDEFKLSLIHNPSYAHLPISILMGLIDGTKDNEEKISIINNWFNHNNTYRFLNYSLDEITWLLNALRCIYSKFSSSELNSLTTLNKDLTSLIHNPNIFLRFYYDREEDYISNIEKFSNSDNEIKNSIDSLQKNGKINYDYLKSNEVPIKEIDNIKEKISEYKKIEAELISQHEPSDKSTGIKPTTGYITLELSIEDIDRIRFLNLKKLGLLDEEIETIKNKIDNSDKIIRKISKKKDNHAIKKLIIKNEEDDAETFYSSLVFYARSSQQFGQRKNKLINIIKHPMFSKIATPEIITVLAVNGVVEIAEYLLFPWLALKDKNWITQLIYLFNHPIHNLTKIQLIQILSAQPKLWTRRELLLRNNNWFMNSFLGQKFFGTPIYEKLMDNDYEEFILSNNKTLSTNVINFMASNQKLKKTLKVIYDKNPLVREIISRDASSLAKSFTDVTFEKIKTKLIVDCTLNDATADIKLLKLLTDEQLKKFLKQNPDLAYLVIDRVKKLFLEGKLHKTLEVATVYEILMIEYFVDKDFRKTILNNNKLLYSLTSSSSCNVKEIKQLQGHIFTKSSSVAPISLSSNNSKSQLYQWLTDTQSTELDFDNFSQALEDLSLFELRLILNGNNKYFEKIIMSDRIDWKSSKFRDFIPYLISYGINKNKLEFLKNNIANNYNFLAAVTPQLRLEILSNQPMPIIYENLILYSLNDNKLQLLSNEMIDTYQSLSGISPQSRYEFIANLPAIIHFQIFKLTIDPLIIDTIIKEPTLLANFLYSIKPSDIVDFISTWPSYEAEIIKFLTDEYCTKEYYRSMVQQETALFLKIMPHLFAVNNNQDEIAIALNNTSLCHRLILRADSESLDRLMQNPLHKQSIYRSIPIDSILTPYQKSLVLKLIEKSNFLTLNDTDKLYLSKFLNSNHPEVIEKFNQKKLKVPGLDSFDIFTAPKQQHGMPLAKKRSMSVEDVNDNKSQSLNPALLRKKSNRDLMQQGIVIVTRPHSNSNGQDTQKPSNDGKSSPTPEGSMEEYPTNKAALLATKASLPTNQDETLNHDQTFTTPQATL